MAYKAVPLPQEPEEPMYEWRPPNLGGGYNINDLEMNLPDNQSPRLLNMWYADRVLSKRYGQDWFLAADLSAHPILSVYEKKYKGYVIFAQSTKLYKLNLATAATTEIHSGLTANKGSFFVMNDILYYINGAQFVQWNGSAAASVTGYIPTVVIVRPPAGGGTVTDNYNRLAPGFRNSFNGDGVSTLYYMTLTGLDAATVTLLIGGVAKTEGTHFTVDRTAGTVNFAAGSTPHGAPASGTNNVIITAYKTDSTALNSILNCKYSITFGGANDSRVFFCGNATGSFYWSALLDPTYWPEQSYNIFDGNDTDCTGFGKQYDVLMVFKPYATFGVEYSFDGSVVSFPTKTINPNIGCDMPYTIRLVNNRLTWCNTYAGVHTLSSTLIKDERNVRALSRNINGTLNRSGLLNETNANLIAATGFDWQSKNQYWLCVGTTVYMWDYGISPYQDSGDDDADQRRLSWWYFSNVNVSSYFDDAGTLYLGDRTVGNFNKLIDQYNDNGVAISAYYRIPLRNFGLINWYKTIKALTITCRTDTATKINLEYITERDNRVDPQPILLGSFAWNRFSWATFTWFVLNFGKSFTRYPNSKHVLYWSVEFSNNDIDRDMSIMDIVIRWLKSKKIK